VTVIQNGLYDDSPKLQQDVLLFAGDNCTGDVYRSNASIGHPALGDVGFDNRARSIKFVVDPCQFGSSLCLYSNVLYDGAAQIVKAQPAGTCTT
jgi:hypothetical protein